MVRNIPPVVRESELVKLTGRSRMSIIRDEAAGHFPRRFKLSPHGRAVGWRGDEIAAWIDERSSNREQVGS